MSSFLKGPFRMKHFLAVSVLALSASLLFAENTVSEAYVPMRDGAKLYTMVQLPAPTGKFPVIVSRGPYNNTGAQTDWEKLKKADLHGYAWISQHCRGTGKSEGKFIHYANETNDGLDLLTWIRKQPFYNGEIFLVGSSYGSSVHLAYIGTNPKDVKGAFLRVQDSERYNIIYRNGFYKPGLHGNWALTMYCRSNGIKRKTDIEMSREHPLAGMTERVLGVRVPHIEEEFLHPDPTDPFWKTPAGGSEFRDACNKCDFPILLLTAMYDIYANGVMDMWRNLRPDRKAKCAIVVTPFSHAYNKMGEQYRDFADGLLHKNTPDLTYLWFDHIRTGAPLKFIQEGKMNYYRLWDHRYVTADDLDNAPNELRFFLAADRTLRSTAPEAGEITYTYDPADPPRFRGGLCNNFGGMKYQPKPNSRPDIISFVSAPLADEKIAEGRFELELHCRSDVEDTCFYVRLSVLRNGKYIPLRDDIDSLCRVEKDYVPGTERVLRFKLGPIACKLLPGDRIRLDVASACAPYFQVHSNYPGVQALQAKTRPSRNTILTGKSVLKLFCR